MSNLIQFLGRFHILILHLPIGILMIACIIIILNKLSKRFCLVDTQKAIPFLLLSGSVSGVLACVLGYMLSLGGGYSAKAINLHLWTAIVLVLTALLTTLLAYKVKVVYNKLSILLAIFMLIMLSVTGHAGGNLTHGNTYLTEHGPVFIKKIAGVEVDLEPVNTIENVQLYGHVIKPIFKNTCVSCHNSSKNKGNLNLTTYAHILKGGNVPAVIPNNIKKSELYKRITLPHGDKKRMPTEGKKPLSDNQIKMIASWIRHGAKKSAKVKELKLSQKEIQLLKSEINFLNQKAIVPKNINVLPLIEKGFYVTVLPNGYGLDVSYYPRVGQELTLDVIKSLLPYKNQIVWLRLSRNSLSNKAVSVVSQFKELKKLHLDCTNISNIAPLKELHNLELLNIYNVLLSDESQLEIVKKSNLKLKNIVR